MHSLAQALSLFNCRFFFISPEALAMPDYICEELEEKGIQFSVHETMEEVMPELDILYMTRVQKERFDETEYKHMAAKFVLEVATLEGAKPTMKILHPCPASTRSTSRSTRLPTPTTSSRRRTGFMHARRCWLWY